MVLFLLVPLLVVATYFFMSSVPLLTLKHETAEDARFIRSYFDTNYRVVLWVAVATAVLYAVVGRFELAASGAAVAASTLLLRRTLVARMDRLRRDIPSSDRTAVAKFRRVHALAIVFDAALLALVVSCLVALSMKMR